MSTKPTISLARWADLGGSFVTDASSGLRDTGFLDATPAAADIVNAELKQLYLWALYLNDGALSGNHSIAGTLGVTGAATLSSSLSVTGNGTVGGTLTVGPQALSFTSFTFTADSTTDQLTALFHPLQTGDGPVQVSNSGGGLPGGLASATNYWVIRVTGNALQLATSLVNALSGVVIDITSNGTGTQTLAATGGTLRPTDASVTRNLSIGGNATIGGRIQLGGSFNHSITNGTSLVTGNNNDYVIPSSTIVRIAGVSGSPVLTGMSTPFIGTGQQVTLVNSSSVSWAIAHQSASSASSARFILPGSTTLTLASVDQAATFWWDGNWRMMSKNF